MISGELLIVSSGSISIPLHHGKPDRARVRFKDEVTEVPCAVNIDQLDFEIDQLDDGSFVLIIDWSVSGARSVIWEADY